MATYYQTSKPQPKLTEAQRDAILDRINTIQNKIGMLQVQIRWEKVNKVRRRLHMPLSW